ncbi:MAG: hypothetical protein WD534_13935 [Phycisphaeraceae bacterium]
MSENFQPPTVEQIESLLARHPLRPPSQVAVWAPLLLFAAMMALVLLVGGVWGVLLPWAGLGAMFGYLVLRVRRAKLIDQRVTRAQELAMLRHHDEALAMGWRLLPAAETTPGPYLRTMTLLGHCLEELKAYEAAIACFDRLLEMMPKDHPGTVHLRIHRAMAALGAERLLDADDALRQLRGTIRTYARTPVAALYRLAELIQSVRTGHYDDPLADADTLLDDLRPLGIEAGYGHALLALCYHRARPDTGDSDTADPGSANASARDQHEQARAWWRRATTLLSPEALVARFPELAVMEEAQR